MSRLQTEVEATATNFNRAIKLIVLTDLELKSAAGQVWVKNLVASCWCCCGVHKFWCLRVSNDAKFFGRRNLLYYIFHFMSDK